MTGPAVVYGLCLMASVACAFLLLRGWRRSRAPLLLWSGAAFALLALNNLLVVLDMVLLPGIDFGWPRLLTSLAAVGVLLYGFIWEAE